MRQAQWNPLSDLIEAINDLPAYGKALLIAMLIGLSVINLSGLALEWRDGQREVEIAHEADLGEIEEKLDTAEASMIYRDDARTRSLLGQAAELIAALPERTEKQRQDRDALTERLEGMRREVNRVTTLSSPETVAGLNGEAGPLTVSRLVGLGSRAYALAGGTQPFAVERAGGAAALTPPLSAEPSLFLADGSGSRLLAIQADGKMDAWTFAGGRTAGGTVAWNAADIRPTAAVTWGARLYVLDAPHSRILLHQATETGYGPSQPYLKDGTDVSLGVSLTVDGSLYILQGDGQVIKIRLGERQNFAVATVEPAFSQATAIHTEEAGNRIWVLDPANRRIVAFSKADGSLAGQYVHDRLAHAVGLAVSESDGTALVAVGHEILKFRLTP